MYKISLIQTALFSWVINKVTRVPETRLQAPLTPCERHLERNQNVPGRPGSWGPSWNLLVSLQVSLRGSYGSLKASFRNPSYFVYNLPGCLCIVSCFRWTSRLKSSAAASASAAVVEIGQSGRGRHRGGTGRQTDGSDLMCPRTWTRR
jgi:hypothetical protein